MQTWICDDVNGKFLAQGMQGTQLQHAQIGQKTAISNHIRV